MARRTFQRLHDIRLNDVKVLELFVRSNERPTPTVGAKPEQFSFHSEHSPYDLERKSIRVWTTAEIGMGKSPATPFSMRIQIIGFFSVDEEKFDIGLLDHWAERNAPMILYPFVREHAYALSARCGFQPVILPLMVLPTLVPKKKAASSQKEKPVSGGQTERPSE
jgi:preprotein translocase subunit SecB